LQLPSSRFRWIRDPGHAEPAAVAAAAACPQRCCSDARRLKIIQKGERRSPA
jgi:hypothetical protein